ncbi:hypothetical protein [Burkholderia gladioli]|uniref:hypothetical protein n=1 Tax=Burkholderia gladioli TaxID=28095 RepID=UPI001640A169|nr:hypothetical protein [Burkholderia gladioli]MBU9174035.1 hypothetical protein [Burkholderia gladioli]
MALYQLTTDSLVTVPSATYRELNLREKEDVQRVLRDQIEVILADSMVLAEEFGEWEDSKRRIDLLCLDRNLQLVVVELKRTEDGGHMELQALRYAAMVSTMRFDQAVDAHRNYLTSRGLSADAAETAIRAFIGIPEGPVSLAGGVRIVLVSADFSKEITSTVLWLNAQGIDVTCVRAVPYPFKGHTLLNVQQVVPLPEAAEFQVAIREKSMEAAAAESRGRDFTRYRVGTRSGQVFDNLPKRRLIYHVVREAIAHGLTPDDIRSEVPWRSGNMFLSADGTLTGQQLMAAFPSKSPTRFFCSDEDLIHVDGKTFALSNQWGERTEEAVSKIVKRMPGGHGLTYEALT